MNRLSQTVSCCGAGCRLFFGTLLSMYAFSSVGAREEDNATASQRFLRDYPAAARRIEKAYENVKMTSEVTMYYPDVTVHEQRTYWATDNAVRCDVKRQRSIQPGYEEANVSVASPSVSFALSKNSKPGWDRFRIARMGTGASSEEPARSSARVLSAPTYFFNQPIVEFIKQRSFELEKVEADERDGRNVVVVSWSCPLENGNKRWGEFVFDAKSWVALKTSLNLQGAHLFENGKPDDKVLVEQVMSYGEVVDGIPVLEKIELFGNPKSGRRLNEVEEITSYTREVSPPEHFSLAAFGMNARSVTPRRTGLYVLIGLTIASIALFAILRAARRRMRSA